MLGIELHTRRRNRANGRLLDIGPAGIRVAIEETVGNCPKYIQGRDVRPVREPDLRQPVAAERLSTLDSEACALVGQADTLFVASHAPAAGSGRRHSADVSHRGGRRGFVRVEDGHTLLVPDFSGNHLFMTLGNLALDPRAGLLFVDFESGDLLSLSGEARVLWDDPPPALFDGAERAWRFRLEEGWRLRDALPLRWQFRDRSPATLATGQRSESSAAEDTPSR